MGELGILKEKGKLSPIKTEYIKLESPI